MVKALLGAMEPKQVLQLSCLNLLSFSQSIQFSRSVVSDSLRPHE